MGLAEKKAERTAFVRALYELADADQTAFIDTRDVFEHAGLPLPEYRPRHALLTHLKNDMLIEVLNDGGGESNVRITHYGVEEVETLLDSPDEETLHLASVPQVTVYVQGHMINSNIAAASNNVTQTVRVSGSDLSEWATHVIEAIKDDALPESERTIVLHAAEVLRDEGVELQTSNPSKFYSLGNVVMSLLLGVAGNVVYSGLAEAGQSIFG